jgi:hypothetical protein
VEAGAHEAAAASAAAADPSFFSMTSTVSACQAVFMTGPIAAPQPNRNADETRIGNRLLGTDRRFAAKRVILD